MDKVISIPPSQWLVMYVDGVRIVAIHTRWSSMQQLGALIEQHIPYCHADMVLLTGMI